MINCNSNAGLNQTLTLSSTPGFYPLRSVTLRCVPTYVVAYSLALRTLRCVLWKPGLRQVICELCEVPKVKISVSQNRSFLARAFYLARPGVAPPLERGDMVSVDYVDKIQNYDGKTKLGQTPYSADVNSVWPT